MIDEVWNAGEPERLPQFWVADTRAAAEQLHAMPTTARSADGAGGRFGAIRIYRLLAQLRG
jgi:hypothetical protein